MALPEFAGLEKAVGEWCVDLEGLERLIDALTGRRVLQARYSLVGAPSLVGATLNSPFSAGSVESCQRRNQKWELSIGKKNLSV